MEGFKVIVTRENVELFFMQVIGGRISRKENRFYPDTLKLMKLAGYDVKLHRGRVTGITYNGHKLLQSYGQKLFATVSTLYIEMDTLEEWLDTWIDNKMIEDDFIDIHNVMEAEFISWFGVYMEDAGDILRDIESCIKHYQMLSMQRRLRQLSLA